MPGWTTQVRSYLSELYEYWREIIIGGLGALFLVAGFLILYPIFWFAPMTLRYLLMVLLPLTFILLAVVTWSFLPIDYDWGVMEFAREPAQWVDVRIFYEKYRKYLLFGAATNVLYFLGLGVYFYSLGDQMYLFLSSLSNGIPILLSWMILNCGLVIASCVIIYLSEPSSRILPILAPLVPGLGQVMNGEAIKGKIFLLGVFLGFFLHHMLSIMVGLAIWLYSFYDAYEIAGKDPDGSLPPKEASGNEVFIHLILVWIAGALVLAKWYFW